VDEAERIEEWHILVHVCGRWRDVVFASPRRLNLRLLCTARKRVRELLHVWPALPIVICDRDGPTSFVEDADNIIAALEKNDRVCNIALEGVTSSVLGRVAAAMQKPFPELTGLELRSNDSDEPVPVLPDSFLAGSTRLRLLDLDGIPFPALPVLLLSANHLVKLHLHDVPHSGYFSPQALVDSLFTSVALETLLLEFRSPLSRPIRASRSWRYLTRAVLPTLTSLCFTGVSEYLEDLVSRIDTPRLDNVTITFFNQLVFDIPLFRRFITRTEMFMEHKYAKVDFNRHSVEISFSPEMGTASSQCFRLGILCAESDWQVLSLAQVCPSFFPTLSTLKRLDIVSEYSDWQHNAENSRWLELLRPFTAVQDLYLSEELALHVTPAIQEGLAVGQVTEVLPALLNLFVEGLQPPRPVQEAIEHFVAARQLSGIPINVHRW
jgi:hypothetical protein